MTGIADLTLLNTPRGIGHFKLPLYLHAFETVRSSRHVGIGVAVGAGGTDVGNTYDAPAASGTFIRS
jgi:hypothetical protein